MPIYTVCSTDPDNYGEVIANLSHSDTGKMNEIVIMSMCTLANFQLVNSTDYIILEVADQIITITCGDVAKLSLEMMPDYLAAWFLKVGLSGMIISINECNLLSFIYTVPFKIVYMTYNLRIACGFYYIKEGSKYDFPIWSEEGEGGAHEIISRGVPLTASTPILYLLANIGNSCYRMGIDQGNIQGGSIGMIIHNSFYSGAPMVAQQADIVCRCWSSDLTFIRLSLVDANFHPIKLLNPLFATMSINEIAGTED